MNNGIDVLFDKFELKPGHELNDFMERSVKDPTVTHILLLLNEKYRDKADLREGGVGKETQIISEELYNKVKQTKIIPIIFEKGPDGEVYKPAYLGSTFYIDLADESNYNNQLQLLIKSIYGESVYRKPELGTTPAWVTDEITFDPKLRIAYEKLTTQHNAEVNEINFISYLNDVKNKIIKFPISNNENCLGNYKNLITIRNEYLKLLNYSMYVIKAEAKIATFFEDCLNEITGFNTDKNELLSILLHEMFIYTIAYFMKYNKFNSVGYLLGKTYFIHNDYANKLSTYSIFYSTMHDKLDEEMCTRDNKRYYTGVGTFWIENINIDFCSIDDFVLADIICFNYSIFAKQTDLEIHWFPITYIYGVGPYHKDVLPKIATKLQSKEFLQEALQLFNYDNEKEFIDKYKTIEDKIKKGEFSHYRYSDAFYGAPILCHYTSSSNIAKYN